MSEYIAIIIGRWQWNHVPLAWSYDLKVTARQQREDIDTNLTITTAFLILNDKYNLVFNTDSNIFLIIFIENQ